MYDAPKRAIPSTLQETILTELAHVPERLGSILSHHEVTIGDLVEPVNDDFRDKLRGYVAAVCSFRLFVALESWIEMFEQEGFDILLPSTSRWAEFTDKDREHAAVLGLASRFYGGL